MVRLHGHVRSLGLLGALLALALCLGPPSAHARPGDLDRSFGDGGRVVTPFADDIRELTALARQPDGRLLAMGSSEQGALVMARYRLEGSLDPSFANEGRLVEPNSRVTEDLALQPDGGFVVAGDGLVRHRPDGTVDPSFGSGGRAAFPFTRSASRLARQRDGRLVAAGYRSRSFCPTPCSPKVSYRRSAVALARYRPDGSLDPSFGQGGRVVTGGFGKDDGFDTDELAIQPDGRILVLVGLEGFERHVVDLLRYRRDGSLDESFGGDGRIRVNNADAGGWALAVAPRGRVLVATDYAATVIARYRRDGSLDRSFGHNGRIFTDFRTPARRLAVVDLLVAPDGRILASGVTGLYYDRSADFAVARFRPDGSPDRSFGRGGLATTSFDNANIPEIADELVLQPDGNIVAAGHLETGRPRPGFLLARFRG